MPARGAGSPALLPVVPLPWSLRAVPHRYFSHIPSHQASAMPAKSQPSSCMRTSHSSCLFPWFPASTQRQLWHILLIPSLILPLSFLFSSQTHFLDCADSETHMQSPNTVRYLLQTPQILSLLRAAWCRGSTGDFSSKGDKLISQNDAAVPLPGL